MGKRGPKPTPTSQLKLRNSRVLYDRPEGEVEPQIDIPPCPPIIKKNKEAKKEWDRITPLLAKIYLLSEQDLAMISGYCQAWAEVIQTTEYLDNNPWIITASTGGQYQTPMIGIRNKAWEKLNRYAGHFGLSPSARAGLTVETKQATKDKLADILSRRSG